MIVVYEVTSGDSFSNVKRWLHEIDTNCENVQKVLGEAEIFISKTMLGNLSSSSLNSETLLNFRSPLVFLFYCFVHLQLVTKLMIRNDE